MSQTRVSTTVFLASIDPSYVKRYEPVFENLGFEHTDDMKSELYGDDNMMPQLREKLAEAGAKEVQLRKIVRAIDNLSTTQAAAAGAGGPAAGAGGGAPAGPAAGAGGGAAAGPAAGPAAGAGGATGAGAVSSIPRSRAMGPILQDGQTVKVVTGRGRYTNYGNYRRAGHRGVNMPETLEDCETGIHYLTPSSFVKAQFLKIGNDSERNGWDYIQCRAGINNEWVFMNSLRV